MTSPAVGFQKIAFAPRLTGMAVGGLLGAAAAPEDQGMTGALAGAGMGYMAGALGSHLHGRLTGPKPTAPAAAGAAAPHPGYDPAHMREVEDHLSGAHLTKQINAAAAKGPPAVVAPNPRIAEGQKVLEKLRQARSQSPSTLRRAQTVGRKFLAGRPKVGFYKLSEHSVSVSPQGASLGLSRKDERLEGMNRWVPRSTLEHAFTGVDEGYDDQALTEQAAESGNIIHPALGAALGAALAHYGIAPSVGAKVIGGLAGAGLGSMYNRATTSGRVSDMQEALKGVHHEKHRTQETSREATPMVVSAAGGDT